MTTTTSGKYKIIEGTLQEIVDYLSEQTDVFVMFGFERDFSGVKCSALLFFPNI